MKRESASGFPSCSGRGRSPAPQLAGHSYVTPVTAGADVARAREITIGRFSPTVDVNLNVNLRANADLVFVDAGYVFTTPVFGGQLNLAMLGPVGNETTQLNGTLTLALGPFVITRLAVSARPRRPSAICIRKRFCAGTMV